MWTDHHLKTGCEMKVKPTNSTDGRTHIQTCNHTDASHPPRGPGCKQDSWVQYIQRLICSFLGGDWTFMFIWHYILSYELFHVHFILNNLHQVSAASCEYLFSSAAWEDSPLNIGFLQAKKLVLYLYADLNGLTFSTLGVCHPLCLIKPRIDHRLWIFRLLLQGEGHSTQGHWPAGRKTIKQLTVLN